MAPNTSGDRFTDHIRQVELAHMALQTALVTLKQNGIFIAKVFDGEDAHPFVLSLSQHFSKVRRVKPVAVRNESVEFFVVCMGKKKAVHWSRPKKVTTSTDEMKMNRRTKQCSILRRTRLSKRSNGNRVLRRLNSAESP